MPALSAADQRTPVRATSWTVPRILRPSLTDVFLIGILLWSFVLAEGGWARLLRDGDTALHTRIGDYVRQTHTVPVTDPFSFSRPAARWLATEWGTGVIFSYLNSTVGLKGIVFVSGVLIALTLVIVLRTAIAAGGNGLLSIVLALIASNACSLHYHARPHVFTWFLLAVANWILVTDERHPSWRIWMLPAIAAVWANLHGGFAILFLLLACYVAGSFLRGSGARPALWRYLKVSLACGLAILVNPFGWNLPLETLSYLRNKSIMNTIDEFHAPSFRSEAETYFMILLFLGLAVCWPLVSKRRYSAALLVAGLAAAGLTSVRHVPVFAICAVPVIAAELSIAWQAWASQQSKSSIAGILHDVATTLEQRLQPASIWSAVILALVFFGTSSWPTDFDSDRFPVATDRKYSSVLEHSRLFTTDQWADYLMYKNPAQRVFFDDRAFYGAPIAAEALAVMDASQGWKQIVDKYQIDAVLCPNVATIASVLAEDSHWKLVDRDGPAMLFTRQAK